MRHSVFFRPQKWYTKAFLRCKRVFFRVICVLAEVLELVVGLLTKDDWATKNMLEWRAGQRFFGLSQTD